MQTRQLLTLLIAGLFAASLAAHNEGENGGHKSDKDDAEAHHQAEEGHDDEHDHEDEHAGRAEHFEGKPAKTLDQALTNLREANEKLESLLSQDELSSEDMNQVHKLSYTMENAMARLDEELDGMASDLEWVHKASERLDEKTIRAKGDAYLKAIGKLTD